MKPNARSAAARMTTRPTARSIRLKRVRNCGVRSCKAISLCSFLLFDRQQFLDELGTGCLDLRPRAERHKPFLPQNRKLMRAPAPGPQVRGGDHQSDSPAVQEFMSAPYLIHEVQPPV